MKEQDMQKQSNSGINTSDEVFVEEPVVDGLSVTYTKVSKNETEFKWIMKAEEKMITSFKEIEEQIYANK